MKEQKEQKEQKNVFLPDNFNNLNDGKKKIHLMGIGGAGMSGLALLLKGLGHEVSGCDAAHSPYVQKMSEADIDALIGHDAAHLARYAPDILIYTSAISASHPEIEEAKNSGVHIAKRAEVLSAIFNRASGIGVAGSHGKTTTSSMIALITEEAGLEPTVALGGELCDIGCNAKLGTGSVMVAELDESDGSFELFKPHIGVITNVDWDHVDYFPRYEDVIDAFCRFARNVKGTCVICAEDKGTQILLQNMKDNKKSFCTYGFGTSWTWGATDLQYIKGGGALCKVHHRGEYVGQLTLKVSGDHNILNALAACAASHLAGIGFDSCALSLSHFSGANRRMQFVGKAGDIELYDDYAHHPKEINATLDAVRNSYPHRRIIAVFQPHRYTRTAAMPKEFAMSLAKADLPILLPIYSADEPPIEGVSSKLIADYSEEAGKKIYLCSGVREVIETIKNNSRPNDIILTVGAGDVCYMGQDILDALCGKA